LDKYLLKLLLSNASLKDTFFENIDGTLVFDKKEFQRYVSNKAFLPDSYTAFKNKIGLTAGDQHLSDSKEVVLAWPFKDCVIEGGQQKTEEKRKEIFWNKTLAPDEIDRLLSPKALTAITKHTAKDSKVTDKFDASDNFLFSGNNLLALHSIHKVLHQQVQLIYIDPPYNTGKDSFKYNDSFNHSTWLTFMKNRLEIARDLLKPEGVIFISIDIIEHAYLKVLCDEIFKRENFLGDIVWETATDNNATQISCEHEYVIAYAKNKELQGKWQIQSEKGKLIQEKYEKLKEKHSKDTELIEKELRAWINSMKKSNKVDLSGVSHYSYVDDKGVFYPGNSANTRPGGYTFDILHPKTKKVCKKPDYDYRWPETTFWDADKRGDVLWGLDETTIPKIKKRLDTATELLKGYFYEDNRKSTKALTKLMGSKVFDNPKSINLLKKIIRFASSESDIVLDFFAGSGSTAQAIIEVNAEDDTNRRFILCEQMDYIDTVTIPRVKKCLSDSSFISCSLFPLNEQYRKEVQNCSDKESLLKLLSSIQSKGFVSWNVDEEQLTDESVSALDKDQLMDLINSLLDYNLLYLSASEIDDTDHTVSDSDKANTKKFYNTKWH